MERSLGEDVVFICGTPGQRNSDHACFPWNNTGQESKSLFPLPLQIDFCGIWVMCILSTIFLCWHFREQVPLEFQIISAKINSASYAVLSCVSIFVRSSFKSLEPKYKVWFLVYFARQNDWDLILFILLLKQPSRTTDGKCLRWTCRFRHCH